MVKKHKPQNESKSLFLPLSRHFLPDIQRQAQDNFEWEDYLAKVLGKMKKDNNMLLHWSCNSILLGCIQVSSFLNANNN